MGRDGRTARRHHTGILRRGVWCASRRPPLGVRLFLSHFAVSLRFLPRPSCHLSVVPLSSFSLLSLLPLSRRSPLSRSATPPPPAVPLFSLLLAPFGAAPPSSLHILAPRVYRALLAQGRVFGRPLLSFATQSCHCSGPLSLRTLVPSLMMPALGSPSGASCRLTTGFPLVRPPRSRLTPLPSARLYVRYVRRGSPSMPWTGALSTLYSSLVPLPVPWSCRCFAPMSVWPSRLPSPTTCSSLVTSPASSSLFLSGMESVSAGSVQAITGAILSYSCCTADPK